MKYITHDCLCDYCNSVFEAKGSHGKGAVPQMSDIRSLYPKQGVTDAVIDYYIR